MDDDRGIDMSLMGKDGQLPELAVKESGNFENMLDITEEDIKEIEEEANELEEQMGLGYGLASSSMKDGTRRYNI